MENIFFCVIIIVFIICAFLAWYFIYTTKQNERMRMIEKGISPNLSSQKQTPSYMQNTGIILIGLSIGVIMTYALSRFEITHGPIMPLAIIGLCGGIAMLVANYLGRKNG